MKSKQVEVKKGEKALLVFLIQTREGKYAPIEESSLPYARIKEERENIKTYEEKYYFGIC